MTPSIVWPLFVPFKHLPKYFRKGPRTIQMLSKKYLPNTSPKLCGLVGPEGLEKEIDKGNHWSIVFYLHIPNEFLHQTSHTSPEHLSCLPKLGDMLCPFKGSWTDFKCLCSMFLNGFNMVLDSKLSRFFDSCCGLYGLFLGPGSTVHCFYGSSPHHNPGQNLGQESGQKPDQK